MAEYASILILAALAAAVGLLMLFANALFGPRRPSAVKASPFECGKDPIALPRGRLPVHFYVAAMLFVVFDVGEAYVLPSVVTEKFTAWLEFIKQLCPFICMQYF